MKNNFLKLFGIMIITFFSIFCAGCFQGEANLEIDDAGKVTLKTELMGVPLIREEIEGWKNKMERSNYVTEIIPTANGNLSGYQVTTQYQSIEQFAAQNIDAFGKHEGKATGIQQRKGWFFDAYNFDFVSEAPEDSDEYLDNPFVQSLMPQIKFDLIIKIPYAAEKNNAHRALDDNKTLFWNLSASITNGKDVPVKVQFRIWNKGKVAVTLAAIIILLGGMIYFLKKAKTTEVEGEAAKNMFYVKICAGLLAAIISASTFMLLEPVTFTDADIISSAVATTK